MSWGVRDSRRWMSIAARRAIVASQGPSSRPSSNEAAPRHAWMNACCVASSASERLLRMRLATVNTSRPYVS